MSCMCSALLWLDFCNSVFCPEGGTTAQPHPPNNRRRPCFFILVTSVPQCLYVILMSDSSDPKVHSRASVPQVQTWFIAVRVWWSQRCTDIQHALTSTFPEWAVLLRWRLTPLPSVLFWWMVPLDNNCKSCFDVASRPILCLFLPFSHSFLFSPFRCAWWSQSSS